LLSVFVSLPNFCKEPHEISLTVSVFVCVSQLFGFLCGLCCIKGKKAISSSYNFLLKITKTI
jgi:hypothetical protein